MEPPWKAASMVAGLNIEPSKSAEYAVATDFQVADSAPPGAAKKVLQACSTLESLNTISKALITRAKIMARIVITPELPSVIAVMIAAPVSLPRLVPFPAGADSA